MKLMPGVRLNLNKDSVGMSFGVPGARYTVNSKGRRTVSAGIPGTGLYDVTTLSSGRRSSRSASRQEEAVPHVLGESWPRPNLFASKAERELEKFLRDIYGADDTEDGAVEVVSSAVALKAQYPKLGPAMDLISVLHGIRETETSDAASALAKQLWEERDALFNDRLVRKYFAGIYPSVQITRGIFSSGVYSAQTLGFILSELWQAEGKYDEAVAVLNEMTPDQLAGISLADIEISAGDFDGAIETTEDIENEDDATAMMLVLRGIAFREKGLDDAALECFKRSISKKDRSEGVIHRGLYERAMTYKKLGKKAAAKKDLEKILVDDPQAAGVNEALEAL
jgi:tetratricopeptide (TPR) repeat protein